MTPSAADIERALAPRARPQSRCFVCGTDHPHGLGISDRTAPDGVVTALWMPTHDWEGFENIILGGIVSTVLDEAMSKVVVLAECEALTGEL